MNFTLTPFVGVGDALGAVELTELERMYNWCRNPVPFQRYLRFFLFVHPPPFVGAGDALGAAGRDLPHQRSPADPLVGAGRTRIGPGRHQVYSRSGRHRMH